MPSPIEVERESLIRLNDEIKRKRAECPRAFEQAHAAITAIGEKLTEAHNTWLRETERRAQALAACRSAVRRDAPPPDCSREEYAVQQARQNQRKVEELRARLQSRAGEFRAAENQLNGALERTAPHATATLDQKISDLGQYRGIG